MLIVFDLDFTLWDAGGSWCDQTNPPYIRKGKDIEDAEGSLGVQAFHVRSGLSWREFKAVPGVYLT